MSSKVGTTGVDAGQRPYGAASRLARAIACGSGCSPSTPRAGVPGWPYMATRRRPGSTTWPPPGSWTPVAAVATRAASRPVGPNALPAAITCARLVLGPARSIARPSARGSVPTTGTTRAPAARPVAVTAVAAALAGPGASTSTAVPPGAAARPTSGSRAGVGDDRRAGGRRAGRRRRRRARARCPARAGSPPRRRSRTRARPALRRAPASPRRSGRQRRSGWQRPRGGSAARGAAPLGEAAPLGVAAPLG